VKENTPYLHVLVTSSSKLPSHTLCLLVRVRAGFNLTDPTSTLLLKSNEPYQEVKAQQKRHWSN